MALTQSFKDTVKAPVERDPAFWDALLTEAVDQFLVGGLSTVQKAAGVHLAVAASR